MMLKKFFDVTHSKNREFWFGHLMVLLATIVGVYLAASAGLRTAVEFELIKSDRDSYYMRTALLDELRDNTQNLKSWGQAYRSGQARKFIGKPDDFRLDHYIWITMQDSPGTFEIPGEILTGIRRYYSMAETTLRKMTSRQAAAEAVDEMLEQTRQFEAGTLLTLEQDVEKLKAKLARLGVE